MGAWVAQKYRDKKLIGIRISTLLLVFIVSLICALWSRLGNWDAWAQYFCWTFFYLTLLVISLSHRISFQMSHLTYLFKSIAWIGKISFSLYLLHFPLFKLFGYIHVEIYGQKPTNFLVSLFYIIPTFFFASLFFRFVENPFHQWSKRSI